MNKRAVFLGIGVFLALLLAFPATRDELDWLWTASRGQASDYLEYCSKWPKGLHALQAKVAYEARAWNEVKRAMINEALKKNAAAKPDPAVRAEHRARLERFIWRAATNENAIVSYQNYLARYPSGRFAADARRRIDGLSRLEAGQGLNSTNP